MSAIDLRSDVELGKLTLSEAAELSRILDEKWGVNATAEDRGDLEADFIIPLLQRVAQAGLASPSDHLATIRAGLARAVAP